MPSQATNSPVIIDPILPKFKNSQLIVGHGHVGIVTGWTVKEFIAKKLHPNEYATIGQLYSATRGIDFVIRNLLWLTHISHLVIISATKEDRNAGSSQCLADFFAYGVTNGETQTGIKAWVINSDIQGYIDAEISLDALNHLRQNLLVSLCDNLPEAITTIQNFAKETVIIDRGAPQDFPKLNQAQKIAIGERFGHRIEGKTIGETWVKILHRIRNSGHARPTAYDSQWQEVINLTAVITNEPALGYFPDYLPVSKEFTDNYIGQILDDAPDREGVKYTYGQRLRSHFGIDQINQVIATLSSNPDSARAVMSLWDVTDGESAASPPCLNHIWCRIVDGALTLTATFRSNDMFAAWVANAIGLRALQSHIAEAVGVPMGRLMTISQSAHIYDDCWDNADQVIREQYHRICQAQDYADPAGSFVISINDGAVLVEHLTPHDGEVINCFSGKSLRMLYQTIAANSPNLDVSHALYLGTELQKAFTAMKENRPYQQDR
ncbi:MAG: thymidylate synthase [Pseudanabaena sp. ELA607]